jgi:two-component system cell cycle sensor histidine kinase/response regulator CckA
MLRKVLPKSVELTVWIADGVWPVVGDATQLHQVLMNLCVNARDVMPDGGELTIRLDNLLIDERTARHNIDARPGKFVRLTVADTGPGVPPEVIDKVFEPFFTTKPVGKGTGLGLSTVYSIVRSHGGFVSVESEVGKGTTFYAYLPASEETEVVRKDEVSEDECAGNGETILVVDDEEFILDATREVLERLGYKVLTANDGTEAVKVFEERGNDIDLVVTDIMMPQMDGIATIRALKKMRPDLPIVAASGITGSKIRKAVEEGAEVWLAKPFTTEKLCATLQELLRKHQPGSDGANGQ